VNYLLGLIGMFELLDGLLTSWAIKSQHVLEGNLFVSAISGSWYYLFIKMLGGVVSITALWMVGKRFPKIGIFATSIIFVFYAGVLTWNATILF